MISIIIPIYNAEHFLDRCLQSILSQDTSEWECIMVNDGSTDNSAQICRNWLKSDCRFKFINQVNQGVSAARNNGIKRSAGEWIAFVDADDWLEPNYLSAMIEQATDADIVVSGQIREFANGHTIIYKPLHTGKIMICPSMADKFNDLNINFLLYAPHEKLFRADIIKDNNLSFQIGCSYGEDLLFVYSYLKHINNIRTVNQALYHYQMASSGTLSTVFRKNQFNEDYRQWLVVYDFYFQKKLLIESSNHYLFKKLWGIVYDGIFLYPKIKEEKNYINNILSIPEILQLKKYQSDFQTAKWIKWAILNRCSFIFYLYFYINNKK